MAVLRRLECGFLSERKYFSMYTNSTDTQFCKQQNKMTCLCSFMALRVMIPGHLFKEIMSNRQDEDNREKDVVDTVDNKAKMSPTLSYVT